jgi:hypothetical protein
MNSAASLRATTSFHTTCLHELAHLAAARHFGAAGFVRFMRDRDAASQTRWIGRFQLHGELADDEWRIVALAGAIAELRLRDPSLCAVRAAELLEEDPTLLTGVDLELAHGYGIDDVAQCLAIVAGAWREIEAEAIARASDLTDP